MAASYLFRPSPHLHCTPQTLTPINTHGPRRRHHLRSHPVAADAAARTSAVALRDFWNWLADGGAVASAMESAPLVPAPAPEGGLGLIARRDFAGGEVVVEVPKRLWVDADAVAASEVGRACAGSGVRPWEAMALFLLREKALGEASWWRPYIEILPSGTDSAIFWSDEELLELEGTQLLNTTMDVKQYVQSEFGKIKDEILRKNQDLFPVDVTFEDFLWAFGIIRSRAFPRLQGGILALIPFADLINHNTAITAEDYWEIKGKGLFGRETVFSLRTPAPVKSGEQIYIQYDAGKSNADLALDYGFIEWSSERQVYTLMLEISQSDPFFGDKLDIAKLNGLGVSEYFDIVLGQPLPPQMLPYLRLIALGGTDAFLLESIFRQSIWGHLELPVSYDNEEAVCRAVREGCKYAISAYKTALEEDEELMKRGDLKPRLHIAVGIRAGEKRVLQHINEMFKKRELELGGLEFYQERRLKDLGLIGDNGEIIFWESR